MQALKDAALLAFLLLLVLTVRIDSGGAGDYSKIQAAVAERPLETAEPAATSPSTELEARACPLSAGPDSDVRPFRRVLRTIGDERTMIELETETAVEYAAPPSRPCASQAPCGGALADVAC